MSSIKSILVTGAGGFIGANLCEFLLKQGSTVIGTDGFVDVLYPNEKKLHNIKRLEEYPNFQFITADLRFEIEKINYVLSRSSVIIHLAALPGQVSSWDYLDEYLSCNVTATKNLLDEAIKFSNIKFILGSTSSVYGSEAIGSESSNLNPISPYGISKLSAEHLVKTYGYEYKLNFTILRFFSVYGPNQRPDMAFSQIISKIKKGEVINLFGDGSQSRSNTFVDDVSRAILLCFDENTSGLTLNVCGNESISLSYALMTIESFLGKSANIKFLPRHIGDQIATKGSNLLIKQATGWYPRVDFLQGIKRQIDFS